MYESFPTNGFGNCRPDAPRQVPAVPAATLQWMEDGGNSLDALAKAIATDAMALVPRATRAEVRLTHLGASTVAACGDDAPESNTPVGRGIRRASPLLLPLNSAKGECGTLRVERERPAPPDAADRRTLLGFGWLAGAALDRIALAQMAQERDLARRQFEATFHAAPVGIAHVMPDGHFLRVNQQFAAITGRTRAELLANGFQEITHPDDLVSDLVHVNRLLSGMADRYRMEKRYLRPDGSTIWVNLTVSLIRDAHGAPDFFVSVIEDLSDIKRAEADAKLDPLTGLLNRRGMEERLGREIARAAEAARPLTLVYLDLDGFKRVNDRLGHAHGDQCLAALARQLEAIVRPEDKLARIGGDEFLALLPDLDAAQAQAAVARMEASLGTVEVQPGWHLSGSFGAITSTPCADTLPAVLIAQADDAMFRRKRARTEAR